MHFSSKLNLKVYEEKASSLILSLNNTFLRLRLLCGELTAIQLVQAKSQVLVSDNKKVESDKTLEDNLTARRSEWNLEKQKAQTVGKIGIFKCRKCNSKNATYFQM